MSTGETIFSAKRKCNALKVYRGLDYRKYREYSDSLYKLLLEYTDKIERFSIDECFLDMTEYLLKDTLQNKAKEINKRVREELGFTVNIGMAHNKLLAKMASDFEKPDKIHSLFEEEVEEKMWKLPVSDLFMLGRKTVPKLTTMGIKTIGDLAKTKREVLIKKFGKHGDLIWNYANGIDDSEVRYIEELPKSIGNSITLPTDSGDIEKLEEILLALTEQVTFRLRKYNLLATVVNVQLRTNKFEDFSHQKRLDISTTNTKDIYRQAKSLMEEMFEKGKFYRLVGVRVDGLINDNAVQLSIFENKDNKKQEKLDKAIDEIKSKFGYTSIIRAGSINAEDTLKLGRK